MIKTTLYGANILIARMFHNSQGAFHLVLIVQSYI